MNDAGHETAAMTTRARTKRSNRLPVLIAEIRKYEGLARNHGKAWLMTRLDEGDRLRELKDSVEHGRWLPLLRELGIHEMRARRYMRLAAHRVLIEAKSDIESDFGLTDALNCIADFEEQKRLEVDKEHQARRRKREEDNRKLLAREREYRAAEIARLKGEVEVSRILAAAAASEPPPKLPPLPEPPPEPPMPIARAAIGFTNCVRNCLVLVGPDQHAGFLKRARDVLDSTEASLPAREERRR